MYIPWHMIGLLLLGAALILILKYAIIKKIKEKEPYWNFHTTTLTTIAFIGAAWSTYTFAKIPTHWLTNELIVITYITGLIIIYFTIYWTTLNILYLLMLNDKRALAKKRK